MFAVLCLSHSGLKPITATLPPPQPHIRMVFTSGSASLLKKLGCNRHEVSTLETGGVVVVVVAAI